MVTPLAPNWVHHCGEVWLKEKAREEAELPWAFVRNKKQGSSYCNVFIQKGLLVQLVACLSSTFVIQ